MKRILAYLVIGIAALSASCAFADPVATQLNAYKTLVADYSRTSGGCSPVLSPDGKTLAYMTNDGDVWVLHGFDLYSDASPEPWKISIKQYKSDKLYPNILDKSSAVNIDWSPDGKKLAIGYKDGRLYIAENFDNREKNATVKAIITKCDVNSQKRCPYALGCPRWSPDGKKIAFLRENPREQGGATICMLDLSASKETELYARVAKGSQAWGQPWSPDSKYLVFAAFGSGNNNELNIYVASIDGKSIKKITEDGKSRFPSWSPKSDKIAFSCPTEYSLDTATSGKIGFNISTIGIVSWPGLSQEVFTSPLKMTQDEFFSRATSNEDACEKEFRRLFGAELTVDQIRQLDQRKMTHDDMVRIALLSTACKIGGEFKKSVESYYKSDKNARKQRIEDLVASQVIKLSMKDQQEITNSLSKILLGPMVLSWKNQSVYDSSPVWSKDGKRIAFVRSNVALDNKALYVADVDDNTEWPVFSSADVACISWSTDSNKLVFQSRRTVAMRPENSGNVGQYNGLIENSILTTVGYPEIWMLDMKARDDSNTRIRVPATVQKVAYHSISSDEKSKYVRLYVCPGTVALMPGEKQKFQVFGIDALGNDELVKDKIEWKADEKIGTITPDGEFTLTAKEGWFDKAVSISNADGLSAHANIQVLSNFRMGNYVRVKSIGAPQNEQLNNPSGVTVDNDGLIWVADTQNHKVKGFMPSGEVTVSYGEYGGGNFQMNLPRAVAVDSDDNMYIADSGNYRILKYNKYSAYIAQWGSREDVDEQICNPVAIALDRAGNVYVLDSGLCRVIKFSSEGKFLLRFGDRGEGNGQFDIPSGIAVDSYGNIYVSDSLNNRVQKFDIDGKYVTQWGGSGYGIGQFNWPTGLAIDKKGKIYVADQSNRRIQVFDLDGNYLFQFGNQLIPDEQISSPSGIAIDKDGNVVVVDNLAHSVSIFYPSGKFITKFSSSSVINGNFRSPGGVAVDKSGNLYVADTLNHYVEQFDPSLSYVRRWDSATDSKFRLCSPKSIAIADDGSFYVASSAMQAVKKYDSSGKFVADYGLNKKDGIDFGYIFGIAAGKDGRLYVAKASTHEILVIKDGKIIKQWGRYGDDDGQFVCPTGIALDKDGNVYVADSRNFRVQEFDSEGNFICKWDVDHSNLNMYGNATAFIAVDANGRVYTGDQVTTRIKVFDANGNLLDRIPINIAPSSIAVDAQGNLFVSYFGGGVDKFVRSQISRKIP